VDAHPNLPAAPILDSIVPLGAVPGRLRAAAVRLLRDWNYDWEDVTFAGTATLPSGEYWQLAPGADQVWVLAIATAPLAVGDELESAAGRAGCVRVSAFSGGVIPVIPYQARVYEYLGRWGGGRQADERGPGPHEQHPIPTSTGRSRR
jgi:hypothetical protein